MANILNVSCPSCSSEDKLEIEAAVWFRLGSDEAEMTDDSWTHVWKPRGDLGAVCLSCDWSGTVGDLE